jgi:hypothetical protein
MGFLKYKKLLPSVDSSIYLAIYTSTIANGGYYKQNFQICTILRNINILASTRLCSNSSFKPMRLRLRYCNRTNSPHRTCNRLDQQRNRPLNRPRERRERTRRDGRCACNICCRSCGCGRCHGKSDECGACNKRCDGRGGVTVRTVALGEGASVMGNSAAKEVASHARDDGCSGDVVGAESGAGRDGAGRGGGFGDGGGSGYGYDSVGGAESRAGGGHCCHSEEG